MFRRIACSISVALGILAGALGAAAPALAQPMEGRSQFIVNSVKPEAREAYEAWVADYRALVEGLIADGRMSPEQTCAFRSWRVLVPPAEMAEMAVGAGLPLDYIFIFDPLVDGVSYSLLDYLVAGLGEAEATARLTAYQEMLAGEPTLLLGAPLTGAAAIDRSAVC
jgi:hypothetical protein